MNQELLFKLLQNPAVVEALRPVIAGLVKAMAEELNKPEVQKQIVDTIISAAQASR